MKSHLAVFLLICLASVYSIINSCSRDEELALTPRYANLTDSITTSIFVNITRIIYEMNADGNPGMIASVSVSNQAGEIITGMNKMNFKLRYTHRNQQQCIERFQFTFSDENYPMAIVVTMDYSGSMTYDDIHHMEQAVLGFVRLLRPVDQVQIIKFSDDVWIMNPMTNDRTIIEQAIMHRSFVGGGTAFFQSIYVGMNELNNFLELQSEPFMPVVIAFTDGQENGSSVSLRDLSRKSIELQIPVYTLGFGLVDDFTMNQIADKTGGRYLFAEGAGEIASIFRMVSQLIGQSYQISFQLNDRYASTATSISIEVDVFYQNLLGLHQDQASKEFFFR